MIPDLSYDYEGEVKRKAKIINGMGKKNKKNCLASKSRYNNEAGQNAPS